MHQSQVNVIRILNPFDPSQHAKEIWNLDEKKPQTLRDFFPVIVVEHVVSINGKIVKDEDFDKHYLQDADSLVICPVPAGGGDSGKMILRLVAMIAIMVMAPYLAGYMGFVAGTASYTAAVMGITMVGGMLVTAMIPNKPLQSDFGTQDPGNSATYGADGAKNTSSEGIPVPVGYGRFRFAGNIINLYTENYGQFQDLYMLFNVGEGVVSSISDIEVNGQPITNFSTTTETDVRMGVADQAVMTWFADTITPYSFNQKLSTNWATYSTNTPVDKIRFDITFPTGLYYTDVRDGRNGSYQVHFYCEYKVTGAADNTYAALPVTNGIVGYASPEYIFTTQMFGQVFELPPVGVLPNGYTAEGIGDLDQLSGRITGSFEPSSGYISGRWQRNAIYSTSSGVIFTEKFTQTLRRQVLSALLPEANYTFRFKRVNPDIDPPESVQHVVIQDDAWVTDINEIITEDIKYNNTALLGLKIRITDQLSGIPNVTYMHNGVVIRIWDTATSAWGFAASNNPAWVSLDMLTNARYGATMPDSRIDIDAWKEWAQFCVDNNLQFNGVFDSTSNIWDALSYVFRCGHATPIMIGTRYSLAIERATAPTMMFSAANIVENSFKEQWVPLAERVNEIDVSYFDAANSNKQTTMKIVDQNAQIANGVRHTSINLFGVTNPDQAYKDGLLLLNMNRYIKQSVEFAAPIEAIACSIGDVIYVQHDMPQWGYAGRLAGMTSTSQVTVDRPLVKDVAKNYKFLTLQNSVTRLTGTISGMPSGNWLNITGVAADMAVKRIKIGTLADVEIVRTYIGGVQIADQGAPIGGWVGQTATLVDTDVIEERDVVSVTGNEVLLASPLSVLPNLHQQWMYGETLKVKKPFRVKTIAGSDIHERTISAIEYNESVYDMSGAVVPVPNYSPLDPLALHVSILGADEQQIKIGDASTTIVTVFWEWFQDSYTKADVYVMVDDGPWMYMNAHRDRFAYTVDGGSVVTFKVVAVNSVGQKAAFNTAPTYQHVVGVKLPVPPNVTNFAAENTPGGVRLTWTPVDYVGLKGYEIRFGGTTWADATPILQSYKGSAYLDTKRASGTYTYRIKAVNVINVESDTATSVTIVAVPISDPSLNGIEITSNADFFKIDKQGNIVNSTLTLTANLKGALTGNVTWSAGAGYNGAIPTGTNTFVVNYANQLNDAVAYTATKIDGATYTDTFTIIKLRDGSDALNAVLTNESHTLPASSTGVVSSWVGADGSMYVYVGATQLTSGVTYSVQSNPSTLTASIGPSTGVYSVTGSGAWPDASNIATITFRATINATGVFVDKTMSLAKARQGVNGDAGATGNKTALARLYYNDWATAQPVSDPSGNSTYTWSTGGHTLYTGAGGWQLTAPANSGLANGKLWIAEQTVTDVANAVSSNVSWASGYRIYAVGANGAAGVPGARAAVARAYQWASSTPATPTGAANYTWSNGTIDSYPGGWSAAPSASTPGYTLYEASVNVADAATSTTTAFNWNNSSIKAAGYAGNPGGSQRIAYAKSSLASVTGTTVTTAGNTSFPPDGSWSVNGWTSTPPTPLANNEYLYQTNGVYNATTNQTIWEKPFWASLKVGSLSAITVNTGALTVDNALTVGTSGYITGGQPDFNSGTGFFLGYSSGQYKFSVGNSAGNQLKWDGTTLTIPAAAVSGTFTANQIDVGTGGKNMVPNSGPQLNNNPITGWFMSWNNTGRGDVSVSYDVNWSPKAMAAVATYWGAWTPSNGALLGDIRARPPGFAGDDWLPVVAGKTYECSVYASPHRCLVHSSVVWLNASGADISEHGGQGVSVTAPQYSPLSAWQRSSVIAVAPAGAAYAKVGWRVYGTGFNDPYSFCSGFYFGEALAGQTTPSPWTPNNGLTQIDGSGIRTGSIAADRISSVNISVVNTAMNAGYYYGSIQMDATSGGRIRILDGAGTERVRVGYLL